MTTDTAQDLLDKLRAAINSLTTADVDTHAPTPLSVHSWALQVLQDGFQGSSSLPHVWSVITAMGRAHPLLLSKDIQAAADQSNDNSRAALHAWVTMALQSGSFSTFIRSLPTQSQVACVYAATAPARQRAFGAQAAALLQDAQAAICEHFLQQEQHQSGQPVIAAQDIEGPVHSGIQDVEGSLSATVADQHDTSTQAALATQHDVAQDDNQSPEGQHEGLQGIKPAPEIEGGHVQTKQPSTAENGSSAGVVAGVASSQPEGVAAPLFHIETEEDARARKEAAASAARMPRFWPSAATSVTTDSKPSSTQGGAGSPGPGAALAGQQQAVAKAAVVGWQGALLALDYAKQGVEQAKLNWAWPKIQVQHAPATPPDTTAAAATTTTTTTQASPTNTTTLPQAPSTSSTSATSALPNARLAWMLPNRWRAPNRPSTFPSGDQKVQECIHVRVHLSVHKAITCQQQGQHSAGKDSSCLQESGDMPASDRVQVRLEVSYPEQPSGPLGSDTDRASADQQSAAGKETGAAAPRQPHASVTNAPAQAQGQPAGQLADDSSNLPSVGSVSTFSQAEDAAGATSASITSDAVISSTAGYGLSSWMRGTAASASAGAASAAGALSQVQWRAAAASMLSVMATATNKVAVRRPGKADTGSAPAEPREGGFNTSAGVQSGSSSGTTSGTGQVASSMQYLDGADECDVLEDMREVLQGMGGLVTEQHGFGPRVPNLPNSRLATMLHIESMPVLHDNAASFTSIQAASAAHRKTSSAQYTGAGSTPHIVLPPPTEQHSDQAAPKPGCSQEQSHVAISTQAAEPSSPQPQQLQQQQQQEEIIHVMVLGHHQRVDEYGEQYTTYELEVQSEHGNVWKVHRRLSEFVTLKKALVALQQQQQQQNSSPATHNSTSSRTGSSSPGGMQHALVLPGSWDQVSQSRGVLGRARLSADVIHSREALLSKCMSQLLATNPPPRPRELQQLLLGFLRKHGTARTRSQSDSGCANLPQGSPQQAVQGLSNGVLQHAAHASPTAASQQSLTDHAQHRLSSNGDKPSISQASLSRSDPGSAKLRAAVDAARAVQAAENTQPVSSHATANQPGVAAVQSSDIQGQPSLANDSVDSTVREQGAGNDFSMTVRLIVDPLPDVADAELERRQGGKCAGCKGPLPSRQPPGAAGKASWLMSSTSTAGVSGPLRCWYTNKLYCSACHAGNTQFIPAAVIHSWDFTARPVCTAAADYLRAVRNQPVLCLPALNPGLYARVPALANAAQLRRRIAGHLQTADSAGGVLGQRAEHLRSGAGLRGYLLVPELLDWWALSDLLDLSLGAFAKMPAWLDKVARQAGALAAAAAAPLQAAGANA